MPNKIPYNKNTKKKAKIWIYRKIVVALRGNAMGANALYLGGDLDFKKNERFAVLVENSQSDEALMAILK